MIIKNYNKLGTSKTRRDALKIINSGIENVLVKNYFKKYVKLSNNILKIKNKSYKLENYRNIYVVGFGKASINMAFQIEKILKNRIKEGLIIDTRSSKLNKIKVIKGTHPLPSNTNIKASRRIINILKKSTKEDLVICLISGGGSSLLSVPRVSLNKLIQINKKLLESGANIHQINLIRKHLSFVKGGQLAQYCKGKMVSLIISDVMDNNINIIASGPTIKNNSTIKQAKILCKKLNLSNIDLAPIDNKSLNVDNILLITNKDATNKMKLTASKLGYKSKIITNQLKGEAKIMGNKLAKKIKKGWAFIYSGETTVKVIGKGKGGRNQELTTSANPLIKNGVIISCSTDGIDFISDASGGIVDGENKLNNHKYLENNDSFNYLKRINGLIKMEKTGTNVGDLILLLGEKK